MNWLNNSLKNSTLIIKFLIIISLFIYIVIRANTLSFTHDEGFTYDIIKRYEGINTANHHILNTALMKNSSSFLGNNEFSYRLPNVLSFLLFGFGFLLIFKQLKNVFLGIIVFSIIFFNPFLIDFFSLARGYGLSFGFMVLSLLFFINLINSFDKNTVLKLFLLFAFGTLSILSNFSTINYYIAIWVMMVMVFGMRVFKSKSTVFDKRNGSIIILFFLSLIPVIFVTNRLMWLKEIDQLYFGEETFYETVITFISSYMYGIKYTDFISFFFRISVVTTIFLGSLSLFLFRKSKLNTSLIILFLLVIIGHLIEHFVFDSKFPKDRTALYIFILYGLFLYATFSNFSEIIKIRYIKWQAIIALLIVSLFGFHFFNIMNYNSVFSWSYDADNIKVISKINELTLQENLEASLSTDIILRPGINYYIHSRDFNIKRVPKGGIDMNSNFIFAKTFDYDSSKYQLIESFSTSNTILLINKGFANQ